jgi:hypothetical protein
MNMKRRRPNIERRTSNAERVVRWIGDRVKEDAPVYGATHRSDSTPNTQRPRPNAQRIRLVKKSKMLPEKNIVLILAESEELIRIFFASVRTAEKNSK